MLHLLLCAENALFAPTKLVHSIERDCHGFFLLGLTLYLDAPFPPITTARYVKFIYSILI